MLLTISSTGAKRLALLVFSFLTFLFSCVDSYWPKKLISFTNKALVSSGTMYMVLTRMFVITYYTYA